MTGTMIEFPEHDLVAYRADPPGKVHGAIIVIEEIWGLVDHIKSVCDRVAAEGYVAIAPDLMGHIGIDPELGQRLAKAVFSEDSAERNAVQPQLRDALEPSRTPEFAHWAVGALHAVVNYAEEIPGVGDRIASVGFCFGGTYSFTMAIEEPRLRAAVAFYGRYPEGRGNPTCPVLAFYGEQDHSITDTLPELQARLGAAGVPFETLVYKGVGHAFFNDTNTHTYHHAMAVDAWARTLEFWKEHLA